MHLRHRDVNRGAVAGPRIYSAGAMIDGLPTTYPDAIGANSPRDARKAVDRLVNAGADLIKVYTRVDPALLKAVIRRGPDLQPAGHRPPGPHRRGDRRARGDLVDRAPERRPRGLPPRRLIAVCGALSRLLHRLDGLRAELGRPRFGRPRSGGATSWPSGSTILVPTLVLHETFSRLDDPAGAAGHDAPRGPERCSSGAGTCPTWSGGPAGPPRTIRRFARRGRQQDRFSAPLRRGRRPDRHRHRRLEPAAHPRLQRAPRAASSWSAPASRRATRSSPATRNGALILGVDSIGLHRARARPPTSWCCTKDPLADIRNALAIDRVMVARRCSSPPTPFGRPGRHVAFGSMPWPGPRSRRAARLVVAAARRRPVRAAAPGGRWPARGCGSRRGAAVTLFGALWIGSLGAGAAGWCFCSRRPWVATRTVLAGRASPAWSRPARCSPGCSAHEPHPLERLALYFGALRTRPGSRPERWTRPTRATRSPPAGRRAHGRAPARRERAAAVPTIWRGHELLDLGRDGRSRARLVGWLMDRQGRPGAYGEGCDKARHPQRVCEHYVLGFFAPAPAMQRQAPITLPNGKVFRAEPAARFAISCLGLRSALRAGLGDRPAIASTWTACAAWRNSGRAGAAFSRRT